MKKLILSLSVLVACGASAQQLTYNSQYMLNHYLINPAAAGTQDHIPIATSFRQQWAGFDDAPKTQMLSGHAKLNDNMGVGGILYNDVTGPLHNMGFQGSYAYSLKLNDKDRLAFGVSLSVTQHVLAGDDFILTDAVDGTLNGTQKSFNPDAIFGMYYYGERHFVGLSIPQLIETRYKFGDQLVDDNSQVRHYYFSGGYRFELGENFEIEPSMLSKMAVASPFQMDINTRLIYKENMWLGLSYRGKESVVAMLGMKRDQFVVGYSYDYTLSNIRKYSVGTHEIYLEFQIKGKGDAGKSSL